MNSEKNRTQHELFHTLLGGFRFGFEFLKNPIATMKAIPDIPIKEVLLVQLAFAATSGLLIGLVGQSIFLAIWGILIYPIVCLIVNAVVSLIVYYSSSYLLKTEFQFSKLYVLVFLASIPEYVVRILSPLVESIDLLGIAISSALLRMGLIYSYKVDRIKATQIVGIMYALLLLSFLARWFQEYSFSSSFYGK